MNDALPQDFRRSWLWRHAFTKPKGVTAAEQTYFREAFLSMREKVGILISRIPATIPELTVHDLTHLDALWGTASLVAEGGVTVSPAEAFVFGASVLLHDAALSLSAYPNGLQDLQQTVEWKDTVAALSYESSPKGHPVGEPSSDVTNRAIPIVLRQLHATQAAALATQGWPTSSGEKDYLIDDPELRDFYGVTIGQIAHSHWWPISRVEEQLSEDLGAHPTKTASRIDKIKLACMLRLADALHLDRRRAPRFLRTLTKPQGISARHWTFQERLAVPHIEHEAVIFTTGTPFSIIDAEAWWLAYDTVNGVDQELQDVEQLMMQSSERGNFAARRVKGARYPEKLARTIETSGWRPVDTQLRVSDIPTVIHTFGGAKLYGDDPTIVLRELIQNSADAIQARRRYQHRSDGWGQITVALKGDPKGVWLTVEDTGIGMSEMVLTGPLLDFGTSFWRSNLATMEFPGLIAEGMNAIGRYGIGFFSVFMLGNVIRVISRRFDKGEDTARLLEFRDGTASRPILSPVERGQAPLDGGTRVEILLKSDPKSKGGLLMAGSEILTLSQLVGAVAPSVSASITTSDGTKQEPAVCSGDWLKLPESGLVRRLNPEPAKLKTDKPSRATPHAAMRLITGENGEPLGRAYICPKEYFRRESGWVTIGGLRAAPLSNIQGLLVGEGLTASRNSAIPSVSLGGLSKWATEQAQLVSASKAEEEYKAKCAEIVLECGGQVGTLPLVERGGQEWFDEAGLRNLFSSLDEVTIAAETDLDYSEDTDDIHPREFRNNFKIGADIFVFPSHDPSILTVGPQSWPQLLTGKSKGNDSNLSLEVQRILAETWSDCVDMNLEEREIGTAIGHSIVRSVYVYKRTIAETEEESQ